MYGYIWIHHWLHFGFRDVVICQVERKTYVMCVNCVDSVDILVLNIVGLLTLWYYCIKFEACCEMMIIVVYWRFVKNFIGLSDMMSHAIGLNWVVFQLLSHILSGVPQCVYIFVYNICVYIIDTNISHILKLLLIFNNILMIQ